MSTTVKTETKRSGGNTFFRDINFSPAVGGLWDDCPLLAYYQDPSIGHLFENDFYDYNAADWTITTTEAGAGSATEAITDEAGGVLLLSNAAGDNDLDNLQWVGEAWQLAAGRPLWFEARVKVNDADDTDMFVGLVVTDTSLIAGAQDGVWFQTVEGSASLIYHCDKDDTDTTGDTGKDLADGTYAKLGIKWDGIDSVSFYVDGAAVAASKTNVPDDELLRISLSIQNGAAAIDTMSIDYIKCFQTL